MRIVVDMMGGDNGLYATLPAVKEFMNRHKDCELTLVGDSEAIGVIEGVEVIDAKKVMRMEAGALEIFRDNGCESIVIFTDNDCGYSFYDNMGCSRVADTKVELDKELLHMMTYNLRLSYDNV